MSPMKAIEIAENIFEVIVEVNKAKSKIKKLLLLTEEQKKLANYLNFNLGVPVRK